MRKNFKKLAALTIAGAMIMGLFVGCGKTDSPKNEPTKAPTAKPTQEASKGDEGSKGNDGGSEEAGKYADYSNGFDKKVTIQIPVYDRAFEGWNVTDNYYTRWIQSEFGDKYNIDVKFTAIGRSTEVTDYTVMLAANTAPNIIFHYDMPQALAYYGEGAMQKLDLEEIAHYAPTYWSNLGNTINTYGLVNDGHYFFFAERPEQDNFVTLIRQDWIDKVGKQMPANLDEYNELLKAWKDAGLGHGGGTLVQNNFTYDYPFRDWPIDKEQRALYSDLSVAAFPTDATYKYLKNMNFQYNNGLIDPEFYLNTDDASTQADFVSGKSGVYSFYLASSSTVIDNLLKNDPDAKFSVLSPYATIPAGGVPQARGYWPFGMIMGINSTTTDEQRAAIWMYLDWMSQPENLFYLQNGIEGVNYTTDADGLAVKVADFAGESKLSNNNNKDYWCLVVEGALYDDPAINHKAKILNWAPIGYENLVEDLIKNYDAVAEYRTPDALFTTVLEKVAEYKSDLNDLWKELYVKCVIASEADFDATYEKAKQEFLDAGYQEILNEKQEAISQGMYN